ncbi:hypothetical protein M436DRAFT_61547 [Aureobasidium namibiae CBS 147.97]|uniref:Uncharacterized protein n=1 Tax=Aureobasidium namibiae CBS 147.97 TaxID=1043004 RepID=A0A074X2R1_9PEZI
MLEAALRTHKAILGPLQSWCLTLWHQAFFNDNHQSGREATQVSARVSYQTEVEIEVQRQLEVEFTPLAGSCDSGNSGPDSPGGPGSDAPSPGSKPPNAHGSSLDVGELDASGDIDMSIPQWTPTTTTNQIRPSNSCPSMPSLYDSKSTDSRPRRRPNGRPSKKMKRQAFSCLRSFKELVARTCSRRNLSLNTKTIAITCDSFQPYLTGQQHGSRQTFDIADSQSRSGSRRKKKQNDSYGKGKTFFSEPKCTSSAELRLCANGSGETADPDGV